MRSAINSMDAPNARFYLRLAMHTYIKPRKFNELRGFLSPRHCEGYG